MVGGGFQQFLQWFYLTSNLVKEAETITGTKIPTLKNPIMLAKYYRNWSTGGRENVY